MEREDDEWVTIGHIHVDVENETETFTRLPKVEAQGSASTPSSGFSKPEPSPIPNDGKPVWEMVIADMRQRDTVGLERYGTRLQTNNGRDALVDCYQEILDAAVYLRQAIEERLITSPPVETCTWKLSTSLGDEIWHTECDDQHVFIAGSPVENAHRFCPYCGRTLVVAETKDAEQAEQS